MEEYIRAELLVMIPALYGLGEIFKLSKLVKNKYIPLILTGISIIFSVIYCWDFSAKGVVSGIIQGVLCTSCAVYGNQVFKQWKQK